MTRAARHAAVYWLNQIRQRAQHPHTLDDRGDDGRERRPARD